MTSVGDADGPISAWQLGERLGGRVPNASTVSAAELDLVDATRDLLDAVVQTDADDATRESAAAQIRSVASTLRARTRDAVIVLVRHDDGRLENLTQAGSGRLNARALPLTFDPLPPPAPAGTLAPVEVVAHCTLDASHSGAPARAHGGVVATMFDEALGVAATAAGASGLTGSIEMRFRRATPLGVPLRVTARCTERAGRKSYASGALWHGDVLLAEATAVFVSAG